METKLVYQPFDKVEADAVAAVLFEDEAAPAELKFASAWLDELRASGEFTGKSDEMAVLHQPAGNSREAAGRGWRRKARGVRRCAAQSRRDQRCAR